jgi:hypothetical protein
VNTTPATTPQPTGIPCHRPFAIAAWILFVLSFLLPAYENALGWECAILHAYFWEGAREGKIACIHYLLLTFANLFMLASPLLVFGRKSGPRTFRWLRIASAISVLLTTTFMLYFAADNDFQNLRPGYFLWIFSFALLGLSFFRGAVTDRSKP